MSYPLTESETAILSNFNRWKADVVSAPHAGFVFSSVPHLDSAGATIINGGNLRLTVVTRSPVALYRIDPLNRDSRTPVLAGCSLETLLLNALLHAVRDHFIATYQSCSSSPSTSPTGP